MMKRMRLFSRRHKGKYALIDDEDYKRARKINWRYVLANNGMQEYATTNSVEEGKLTYLHRFILGDNPPGMIVDHIDGDGLNCQKSNMRWATRQGNAANVSKRKRNKSGYKGVCRPTAGSGWKASIWIMGKAYHIGTYPTKEEAARAYDARAKKEFGEFARLNFPI